MRALGAFPTEKALVLEILPQLQDEANPGEILYH